MAPRVPRTPRQAPQGAAAPRTGQIGDNSAAVEEADRIQMISIVSKLSAAEDAIEAARLPLKAAQDQRKTIIGLGKAAGFTAGELKARLEEMKVPTREMAEKAAREHKHRRWLGILDADQAKLMLGPEAPQEAKDEAHFSGEGYKAGLRQMAATPPTEVPERFVQAYMKAHERGLKEVLTANVPGGHRLRAQAEADFKADNPEVDVAAAAKKLAKDPAFMARSAPEGESLGSTATASSEPTSEPKPTSTSDASTGTSGGGSQSGPGDGFEATPEELAAQPGRQAIVNKREGATSGEVV